MKICLIMGGNEEGGLENHVVEISNALATRNEVHVIAHQKYTDRFKGVHVHPMDLTRSRRNPVLLYSMAKLVRNIAPDIVHAQADKAVYIISLLEPFLPKELKLVATLHSLKRKIAYYESFDWVIGVSESVLGKLKNTNQSVIYNGVKFDESRLKKRSYLLGEFNLDSADKIFVSIGRLVEVKRFDLLIDSFLGIENASLLIVGEGKERQKLESKIEKSGQKNIHLLGHRKDNIEILSSADVCVISSEREGFSYAMAESLLVGTPVISTDVADMRKILPHDAVVKINNSEELHDVLLYANRNYDDFSESYKSIFEWATNNLSFEVMVNKTEQVYRKVTQ